MIRSIRAILRLVSNKKSSNWPDTISSDEVDDSLLREIDQKKRYDVSRNKKKVELPDIPLSIRGKLKNKKRSISRFIDELDYNNQIISSYEITLLERQNKRDQKDVA